MIKKEIIKNCFACFWGCIQKDTPCYICKEVKKKVLIYTEWKSKNWKPIRVGKKCLNCGKAPVYVFNKKLKRNPHMVKHNEETCPYRYETHQHTKELAVKDWNKWITEKQKRKGESNDCISDGRENP